MINQQLPNRIPHYAHILQASPSAVVEVRGSAEYPRIRGKVNFYQTRAGVLVSAEIFGLPPADSSCKNRIFAFHIHSGSSCTGDRSDAFADAKSHYNPGGCDHPYHAGDLPPLWGNDGYAFQVFLTDRFTVSEIVGRTVIVHAGPDDFTSQPSGNAGQKIACGVIERPLPRRYP